MAVPEGCYQPGEIVEVDDEIAKDWLAKRRAERVMNRSEEASPYEPWPQSGCTLQEALVRTADPDLRITARDVEKKLANQPEESSRLQLEHAVDAAQDALTSAWYKEFILGDLVATGTR